MMSPADRIIELEHVVRQLMAETDRLQAEVAELVSWIQEGDGALGVLQALYASPRSTEATKLKAAIGAIGFEIARPAQVSVIVDFKAQVRAAREKANATLKAEAPKHVDLQVSEWSRESPEPAA